MCIPTPRNLYVCYMMQDKVESLEQSLTIVLNEFEQEKRTLQEKYSMERVQDSLELLSLRRSYKLQSQEMNTIKSLAKRVLDQRSDVEEFFLRALSQIRKEIVVNRCIH